MLLEIVPPFAALYVAASLAWRSRWPRPLCACLAAAVLAASLKYTGYSVLGGSFFAPALPRAVLLAWEAGYGALCILLTLCLVRDIAGLLASILSRITGLRLPARRPILSLALLGLSAGAASWGVHVAIGLPQVERCEVAVAGLPAAFDGTTVAQMSDIHIGSLLRPDWLEKVVRKVNGLHPDIAIFTGDLVDGPVAQRGSEVSPLSGLSAPLGVYAVTGNHEYYYGPGWPERIAALGFTLLDNRVVLVRRANAVLALGGLPDRMCVNAGYPPPDPGRILGELARHPGAVVAEHRPENARRNLQSASLQLSGHTHGGSMFFLWPIIAPKNGGFVRGLYRIGDRVLNVNPGTGIWAGFSCRVGVAPQVTLMTLRAAPLR